MVWGHAAGDAGFGRRRRPGRMSGRKMEDGLRPPALSMLGLAGVRLRGWLLDERLPAQRCAVTRVALR